MIMLSVQSGESIWVNPEMIETVGHSDYYKGTVITTNGAEVDESTFVVKESPTEVVKKIMDYKVGMVQYQTYLTDDTRRKHWDRSKDATWLLKKLAGLDDQQ